MGTLSELATSTNEFLRFVVAADDTTAAVDTIARYTATDGTVSIVSSCDIYEFRDEQVVRIKSYAVEESTGA